MKKVLLSLSLLFPGMSFAQTSECDCSAALATDLKTVVDVSEMHELKAWLSEYFLKDSTSQKAMKKDASSKFGATGKAVIEGLPIEGAADYSSANTKASSAYSRLVQLYRKNQYVTDTDVNLFYSSYMSDAQLAAYTKCLEACPNVTSNGIKMSVAGNTSDEFLIQVRYADAGTFDNITLQGNAKYSNLEPIGPLVFKDGLEIGRGRTFSQHFKRVEPGRGASFTVDVKEIVGKIQPLDLKPIEQNINSFVPIGTIVASVLHYEAFLNANGLIKIDKADMDVVPWVPCDGRSLTNSKYQKYGGKVPDLRGVFLRGINEYNVQYPSVVAVSNAQKNPENSSGGQFQSDTYARHQHGFGGNYLNDAATQIWSLYGTKPSQTWSAKGNGAGARTSSKVSLTSPEGEDETRPKNVTVYYYVKIN